MATERFRKLDFEAALTTILDGTGLVWSYAGYIGGEAHYRISVSPYVQIEVNSTVTPGGLAADTGDNSIRAWLANPAGQPMGNKIQRWITRQPGWQQRLDGMLEKLINMADAIKVCPACNTVEKVFIVKKDGPNKGRLFLRCTCPNRFVWLDEYEQEEQTAQPAAPASPRCPRCGGATTLRSGKFGAFYGCNNYPNCKGTIDARNVPGYTAEVKANFNAKAEPVKAAVEARKAQPETQEEPNTSAVLANVKQARQQKGQPTTEKAQEVPQSKPITGFQPSKYQQAVFDWITKSQGKNLVVEAVAGSGKTTTGVQMMNLISSKLDVAFICFNSHIQKELAKRAPAHVKASTFHSLGYAMCRQAWGNNIQLDEDKLDHILERVVNPLTHKYLYSPIKQIVALVKATLSGTTPAELDQIVNRYGIELNGDTELVYQAVPVVVTLSGQQTNVIDYDDMCWLPVLHNLPAHKFDVIFVDEAQDTNQCQSALVNMSIKPEGKIIAVGDRYQSIYGFRGADADAIPTLISDLNADVLPLSITYRNPKAVVALVNKKFPEIAIEAAPWAEEGIITTMSQDMMLNYVQPGDMVLCRCNAPLVEPAFALIRRGVKAIIRGRDIGKGLVTLIRKMKADNLPGLLVALSAYAEKEVAKLEAANKNAQAQSVQDKVDTIVALADGVNTISEVEDKIELIFSDKNQGVVFSSVHRAKGLEAQRVAILEPGLMPHPMAKQSWEKQQERNIEYVALTRTLNELIFVA